MGCTFVSECINDIWRRETSRVPPNIAWYGEAMCPGHWVAEGGEKQDVWKW